MAFTYDASTNRGKVRLLIGDNDSTDVLLQDDEVDFFLTDTSNNLYLAASFAAQAIAAQFSRLADTTVEEVSKKYSQQAAQYTKLSLLLESKSKRVASSIPDAVISGISRDKIRTQRKDEDRVQGKFYIDRFSNPPSENEDDDRYY